MHDRSVATPATRYRFADLTLDVGLRQAARDGRRIRLGKLTYELLVALVEAAPNVATHDELVERVWKGRMATPQAIAQRVKLLRKALSDDARDPRYIEVVRGQGCRLIPQVERAGAKTTLLPMPRRPPPLARTRTRAKPIGRDSEIATLERALTEAESGNGGIVLIHGEPGVGKTHLVESFAEDAERVGAKALFCVCDDEPDLPPYWPWLQLLAQAAKRLNEPDLAELLAGDAEAAADLPTRNGSRMTQNMPSRARYMRFQNLLRRLADTARTNLLLLTLDDIHWADASSLRLLEFLARSGLAGRILLVATYRDVGRGRDDPLAHTLGGLARQSSVRRIHLQGLGRDFVAQIVESTVGQTVPPAVVDEIRALTDGNPFFVKEVAKTMAEKLATTPGRRVAIPLPSTVANAIRRDLAGVSPACQELLSMAGVIGRTFHASQLHALTSSSLDVVSCLDEAIACGLVVETEQRGRFRFAHALIAETLYDALPLSRRQVLHRSAAEMLERFHAGHPEPFLGLIARHYYRAAKPGDIDKAVAAALAAARHADKSLATAELAAANYRLVLDLFALDSLNHGHEESAIWLALARAMWRSGAATQATARTFQAALRAARTAGDRAGFVEAACGYVHMVMPLPDEEAVGYLNEALALTGSELSRDRARVLSRKAAMLHLLARHDEARTAAMEAIEAARQAEDAWSLCDALSWGLIAIRPWPDALAERIRRGEEGLALALSLPEHDEPDSMRAPVSDVAPRFASLARRPTSGEGLSRAAWAQQEARLLLHVCYEEAGDTDSANALAADIALAVDRQALFRHSQLPYCCEVMRACSALMEGRWEAARGHAERAYRIGSACGEAGAEGVFSAQMFHLHRELAELQRFEPVLERFEAEHRGSVWSPGLALVYAELGRTEPARRELRRAISEATHQRWSERLVPALALLADTCAQVGDKPEAQLIYSALLPYSGQMAVHATALSYGPVDRYLGALAHVDGDSKRARSHFDAALTLCKHARSRPWLAHTQYAYARLLSDPSGRSDSRARERSIDLLQSATRIAQDLGMRQLLRKIAGAGTELDF